MHFLGYFGEASSCVMANIFFSLPLLMAIRMSFTKATRHLDILGRMIVPWRNNWRCELPGYNRDPWSQISSGLKDESSFWSFTWYNGIPTDSSFRWAISSNKFSRTTWRNWDLRINDPGKYRYINIYAPRTQMTIVLIENRLVLEGWPSKIQISWVLGLCMYNDPYSY